MCDTYFVDSANTVNGRRYFGKNSDREPDEAQQIVIYQGKKYKNDEKVKCTYITIPQVKKTNTIILSTPFWMWGGEMGVNEKGVSIGNEAIFTKRKHEIGDGLIGMDLLRLALERSDTAQEAVDTIINLTVTYGQEGICGYRDKHLKYDNAFLIVDNKKAFILEIFGREWAIKELKESQSISNITNFTINYDKNSENLGKNSKKGVKTQSGKINIDKTYSDFLYTRFAGGRGRRRLLTGKIKSSSQIDLNSAFNLLRLHQEKSTSPEQGSNGDVCMHGGNPLIRVSQSVSSMVVEYDKDDFSVWITGTSSPCTSIFQPVFFDFTEALPGDNLPESIYDAKSLWWKKEVFNRLLIFRWRFANKIKEELSGIEKQIIDDYNKIKEKTLKERLEFTKKNYNSILLFYNKYIEFMSQEPTEKTSFIYNSFWKKLNKLNNIPINKL